ncbi:putative mitochondrial protein [Vitis vinifera]|uniref:Putative mitochondrial protein n=1 Tax=Vitis vinifera TaxID=29760 RepID=A0A438I9S3_VITVI|nr:putative mitochondrial protein [Vitis vinifera]
MIGNYEDNMVTRRQAKLNEISYVCYTSQIEPKNVEEALNDEAWVEALHEELNQFSRNEVWFLVPRPKDVNVIGTKWILKNKMDENGVIVRNKARMSRVSFLVGFSMKKCMWNNLNGFKTLGFMRGGADRTLFIRRNDEVFLVAQIYVDDIVFGSISNEWALDFSKNMKSEFEISMVGELTYFLGFQVKQLKDGIFLSQSKYTGHSFSVGVCARYQAYPKESHLIALKLIISAINISKNPVIHSRTKHIDIRHHFIRDLVEDKVVSLEYVPIEGQIVDILTKPLDVSRFESLRRSIGLCTLR